MQAKAFVYDIKQLNHELINLIFEATEDLVIFLDTDLRVQYANPQFKKILKKEKVLDKELKACVPSSIFEIMLPFLNKILAGDSLRRSFNLHRENDEHTLWYDVSGQPVYNQKEEVTGIYILALPIKKQMTYDLHIEKMLNLQYIVSKISSKLITSYDIEKAIAEALGMIGQFSTADRAYVFEFNDEKQTMSNTYEWCKEGVEPEIHLLKDLPIDTFPWWMKKLSANEIIHIPNVSELPDAAKSEKEILQAQMIKSCLVLPLVFKNKCQGFIGFDHTGQYGAWDDYDVSILSIIAETFSGAFNRLSDENQMKDYYNQLEQTLSALKHKEAQLVQQEQMVAIGHLAAGIAHEINNPLGYTISNIGMLRDFLKRLKSDVKTGLVNDQQTSKDIIEMIDLLEDIDDGVSRVSQIVKGLSYFAQSTENNDYVYYSINEGVKNTLLVSTSQLQEKIEVKQSLHQVPHIFVKASAINQVLLNIFLNSIDAIFENIDQIDTPCIKIETGLEGERVYCKISDNGIGIPKALKNRIFTPFFTTKPEGKGTGLGLSIAYDIIVNQHHGDIRVDDFSPQGTTFTISLPLLS